MSLDPPNRKRARRSFRQTQTVETYPALFRDTRYQLGKLSDNVARFSES